MIEPNSHDGPDGLVAALAIGDPAVWLALLVER
jgi:hypothetical protein